MVCKDSNVIGWIRRPERFQSIDKATNVHPVTISLLSCLIQL